MPEVVLTCDWTMMSNHHGKEFLGFGTTTPAYILPEQVYQRLFFPTMGVDANGFPREAPYGMRKVEAALDRRGHRRPDRPPEPPRPVPARGRRRSCWSRATTTSGSTPRARRSAA